MTTREFYTAVIAFFNGNPLPYATENELAEKARELIAVLDAKNEKRKSSESKEKVASRERRESVLASLTEVPQSADAIAETLGISVGQSRSALGTLVREGVADKAEVKVGKVRKMMYTLHVGE